MSNGGPLLQSVVALRATIPDDAFTAAGLGTLREGSGVVIDSSGLVLTIGYLIMEAGEIWLRTQDGRAVPAYALAFDQVTGFGLVQTLGQLDLPAVELGHSGPSKLGDAITFADGIAQTVKGSIVGKQEFAGYWEYLLDEAIFIAPAHPSWGGAGLFGADGKLLGIGSLRLQMMTAGVMTEINMVVPIDLLRPILSDLTTRGQVNRPARPWLGVFPAETNGEVVVMNVTEGGPAAKAGLQRGDIISDVRDTGVESLADFYRKVWGSGPAGAEVPLRIVRDGREAWLRVKSADRNSFLRKPQLQ
ncbi:MAG: S1C family serine protease [Devosia sp.]